MHTRDDIPSLARKLRRHHDEYLRYFAAYSDQRNPMRKYDGEEADYHFGQREVAIRALNEMTFTGIDRNPWAIGIDRHAQIEAYLNPAPAIAAE